MNTKKALRRVGLIGAIGPLAVAATSLAEAGDFNWRQFEGTTVRAILFDGPPVNLGFKPLVDEFESETGIELVLETLNSGQARKRYDILLSAKDSSFDVYSLQMGNRGVKMMVGGHLENLEPFVTNPALTPPDYDYPDDWAAGCLNSERVMKGQPFNNIVYSAQAHVLLYRKDLFEQHGVEVPSDYNALMEAARRLTIDENGDGRADVYGFHTITHGRTSTSFFSAFLWNFGGSWTKDLGDGKRVSNINSKETVDALVWWGKLRSQYGPPGRVPNHQASAAMFGAGKLAMMYNLNFYFAKANDPKRSKIAGKIGTAPAPAGPVASVATLPTASFAISPYSKNKEAAWTFLAWMTQKQNMLKAQRAGAPVCRKSAWTDPSYEPDPDWGNSAKFALENGIDIAKPQVVAIGEMRDAIAEVIRTAVDSGGDRATIQREADKQAAVMNEIMAKTEKGLEFSGVYREGAGKL